MAALQFAESGEQFRRSATAANYKAEMLAGNAQGPRVSADSGDPARSTRL
jgi:hypothetical protein